MPRFALYNYNFLRIIEPARPAQLAFPGWAEVDVEESFARRQTLLDELLLADYESPQPFSNGQGKGYWHRQIVHPQDGVYVMRVANVTSVTITDEHLRNNRYPDYRNCLVIIDNRPGIQRIAIELRTKAFRETKTVARILEASLSRLLAPRRLRVKLAAVYDSCEFWKQVRQHPKGFTRVRFRFPPLNLERLTAALDHYINTARRDWESGLEVSFGATEGGVVKIDPDNPRQQALIKGAAAAGAPILLLPRGSKAEIHCGEGQNVVVAMDPRVIDRLESDQQHLALNGQQPMDEVKLFMKNLPDALASGG